MTPQEALAAGRLDHAIELQEHAVRQSFADPQDSLFLVELLTFAGRLAEALSHLNSIPSDDPAWPQSARSFRRLIKAEHHRSHVVRQPLIEPDPRTRHARCRWRAVKSLRENEPASAVRWVDAADAASPALHGFIDGREFTDLRDADDRFATVLEAFLDGRWVWFPWEAVIRVKLEPARFLLDGLFRPASLRLKDRRELAVHLPLVYPGSHTADGVYALGQETDFICPDNGPTRCIGGKLLLVDDEEVPLSECQMIEIR